MFCTTRPSNSFSEFHSLACVYGQSGNSVDQDQLASQKPADLDLHYFQAADDG